jgi:hypothetical protein
MPVIREPPVDPLVEAQRLVVAAAEWAGPRLTALAEELGTSYINERDHLQPTYREALAAIALNARSRPQVSTALGHGLEALWPRLGNFDVALKWGAETAVFAELKCGNSEKALRACAWDAVKCAFCLQHGVGAGMLLVAAAPESLWSRRALGLELLYGGEWDIPTLRDRYAKGFATWEAEGYRPLRVPARFTTAYVGHTEFFIAGDLWLLGVARVDALDRDSLDWKSLLADRFPPDTA